MPGHCAGAVFAGSRPSSIARSRRRSRTTCHPASYLPCCRAIASAGVVGDDASNEVGLPPELVNKRVIYFAFDSSEIRAEDRALVAAHAKFLAGRVDVGVRLEGHTDQRGTREYNIGLGERRAQAVRAALGLQGAKDNQLSTVSYGEERPAASGEDEESMAMNRRVELVYGKR